MGLRQDLLRVCRQGRGRPRSWAAGVRRQRADTCAQHDGVVTTAAPLPTLGTVVLRWGRIGCVGFGGPPTHIKLLREECVVRRRWLSSAEFEDAVAACNLLPGPASTQLAIWCAWRVRGRLGGLVGGFAFVLPGLVLILMLAGVFLSGSLPQWIAGAGAGAGAAVTAVALRAATDLLPASWQRAQGADRGRPWRWLGYVVAGALAASLLGPWLVIVLLGCGAIELAALPRRESAHPAAISPAPVLASGVLTTSGLGSLIWVAFKVGALSYGGGFVIIPLMQADAVSRYHWMTDGQFLNAVALGQITPGPVVHTVAVVGYAAAGTVGGILASVAAFLPSFVFVLVGARHFQRLRGNKRVRAFLDGAGPAAIGAILGSAFSLMRGLTQPWQYAVLSLATVAIFVLGRGVVLTLLASALAGTIIGAAGVALPS